ncbi:MAG TPA: hypothetical protein VIL42_04845 [Sphingomicrobium sp.]|jgi:hypothetical protein
MIAALFLAAAAPLPAAVQAELAFARDSQRLGQWTAFRKYADRDAVMFNPQAVWARDFLKGRKDPPKSVRWWPTHAFMSCDGRTAVTTGPWIAPDGKVHGSFTTVWQARGRSWRWVYDAGQEADGPAPAPTAVRIHRANCRRKAPGVPALATRPLTTREARSTPEDSGFGQSADRTLGWDWKVQGTGARQFRVLQWNGSNYAQVLFNDVPPRPK